MWLGGEMRAVESCIRVIGSDAGPPVVAASSINPASTTDRSASGADLPTGSSTMRALLTAILLSWIVVGCSSGPTQEVTVLMTDRGMSVEPTSIGDAARLEFRFVNDGSDTRHPVVVVTARAPDDLRGYLEQDGIDEVISALLEEGGSWEMVYGEVGHYHPGDDEPDLPPSALTRTGDEGDVVRYLYTDEVDAATERTSAVVCCKPGITFGNRGGGTTFLVLTIDGSEQYAIFDLQP